MNILCRASKCGLCAGFNAILAVSKFFNLPFKIGPVLKCFLPKKQGITTRKRSSIVRTIHLLNMPLYGGRALYSRSYQPYVNSHLVQGSYRMLPNHELA